jgi:hypothetical protein
LGKAPELTELLFGANLSQVLRRGEFMSGKSSAKVNGQIALAAFLGFVGASSFSGSLRKEILDDDLRTKNNHPPGVDNPNEVELGN